jgi:hypothetical protein
MDRRDCCHFELLEEIKKFQGSRPTLILRRETNEKGKEGLIDVRRCGGLGVR